jgi:hypothetical protein
MVLKSVVNNPKILNGKAQSGVADMKAISHKK